MTTSSLFQLGLIAMRKANYLQALEFFEELLQTEPGNIGALGNSGSCAFAVGDFYKCIQIMDRILAIHPGDSKALIMRAQAAGRTGEPQLAIDLIHQALNIEKNIVELHEILIDCYLQLDQLNDAERATNYALTIFPNSIAINLFAGLINKKQTQLEKAEIFFKKCISLNPKNKKASNMQAVAYINLNQWDNAINACKDSFVVPPYTSFGNEGAQNSVKNYLKTLPAIQLITTKNWSAKRTIMFAADETYIDKFYEPAVSSVESVNPELNVHLHAMLREHANIALLKKYAKDHVSISYEIYQPEDKTGFTTRRFVRLLQLLKHLNQPILCVDIDSRVVNSLKRFYDEYEPYDIGIYRREFELVINQLVHAAMFYASPTPGAMKFLQYLINYIEYLETNDSLKWFADQMALLSADHWVSKSQQPIQVKQIQKEYLDWRKPTIETLIFTFKGGQKDFLN